MTKTKIVATLGPASSNEDTIKKMALTGVDMFRLNLSHGTYEEHFQTAEIVKKVRAELNKPLAIMVDNKGPEIRIKKFEKGKIVLKTNKEFVITTNNIVGNENIVSVTYKKFPEIIPIGTKILINDGLIELKALSKTETDVVCRVVSGGELSNNKSINLPSLDLKWDYMKDSEINDILFAIRIDAEYLALSFIGMAKDVENVKSYIISRGGQNIKLISKIESRQGVRNLDQIINVSDGVMVARGDLGVEVEFSKIPLIQKEMILKSNRAGKMVITATQMLESMINSPSPTRAEISDIANAVIDGTSMVMLSGETAAGKYPVKSVAVMEKIVRECEKDIDYIKNFNQSKNEVISISDCVAYATCTTSFIAKAKAIVVVTNSGYTAEKVSSYKPKCPIICCTPNKKVYYQMGSIWGVYPILTKTKTNTDEVMLDAKRCVEKCGYVNKGDIIVQTGGVPLGETKHTNLMKVDIV